MLLLRVLNGVSFLIQGFRQGDNVIGVESIWVVQKQYFIIRSKTIAKLTDLVSKSVRT